MNADMPDTLAFPPPPLLPAAALQGYRPPRDGGPNRPDMMGPGYGPGPSDRGMRPAQGSAVPPLDRKQQQRKRRVQKGLEDNVRRTVYISYIDQQVTDNDITNPQPVHQVFLNMSHPSDDSGVMSVEGGSHGTSRVRPLLLWLTPPRPNALFRCR